MALNKAIEIFQGVGVKIMMTMKKIVSDEILRKTIKNKNLTSLLSSSFS